MSAPLAHVRADGVWTTGLLDVTELSSLSVQRITMERVAAGATDEIIITVTGLGGAAGWLFDTAPPGFRGASGDTSGVVLPVVGRDYVGGTLALASQRQPYWRPGSALSTGVVSGQIRYRAGDPRPTVIPGTRIT